VPKHPQSFFLPTLVACTLVCLSACGYRATATIGQDLDAAVHVPAFDSVTAFPELDVWAGNYLSTRLISQGLRITSEADAASISVTGQLSGLHEEPVGLRDGATLAMAIVTGTAQVRTREGIECRTSSARGEALMILSHDRLTEAERTGAYEEATRNAVDQLLFELIMCVEDLTTSSEQD